MFTGVCSLSPTQNGLNTDTGGHCKNFLPGAAGLSLPGYSYCCSLQMRVLFGAHLFSFGSKNLKRECHHVHVYGGHVSREAHIAHRFDGHGNSSYIL